MNTRAHGRTSERYWNGYALIWASTPLGSSWSTTSPTTTRSCRHTFRSTESGQARPDITASATAAQSSASATTRPLARWALVATIAHELGHVLLLGDGRISAEQEDHEPLTDLLTIFFGLGIFSANAAFEYSREVRGGYGYASTSRLGYLTEPMYGYGLARYAWIRGEMDPGWARYVDTNPRTFLKRGLRYLVQANRSS